MRYRYYSQTEYNSERICLFPSLIFIPLITFSAHSIIHLLTMIIFDSDVKGVAAVKTKTNSPLFVNSDRIFIRTTPLELFQSV